MFWIRRGHAKMSVVSLKEPGKSDLEEGVSRSVKIKEKDVLKIL